MKYYGGLPDQEHVPYKIIGHNPHVKDVIKNLRISDWAILLANTTLWPLGLVMLGKLVMVILTLERYKPTVNPKILTKQLFVVTPFFLVVGCSMASMRVHRNTNKLHNNSKSASGDSKRTNAKSRLGRKQEGNLIKQKATGWLTTGE